MDSSPAILHSRHCAVSGRARETCAVGSKLERTNLAPTSCPRTREVALSKLPALQARGATRASRMRPSSTIGLHKQLEKAGLPLRHREPSPSSARSYCLSRAASPCWRVVTRAVRVRSLATANRGGVLGVVEAQNSARPSENVATFSASRRRRLQTSARCAAGNSLQPT